jgi:hypothetical protein
MKTLLQLTLLGALGAGLAFPVLSAAESAVALPTKRHEMLESAHALLTMQPAKLPADLENPFNPPAFAEATGAVSHAPAAGTGTANPAETPVAKPTGPKTEHDILVEIAAALKPSGFFVLGGEPTLVFGQKRVKAGGHLTITFEGTDYTLEISAIDRPNFTLRLNREEFTRPIK